MSDGLAADIAEGRIDIDTATCTHRNTEITHTETDTPKHRLRYPDTQ